MNKLLLAAIFLFLGACSTLETNEYDPAFDECVSQTIYGWTLLCREDNPPPECWDEEIHKKMKIDAENVCSAGQFM